MGKFVLVDGNSIMNRAFYGIMGSKMLITKDGKYTNAVYGFLAIMFKVMEELEPEYMMVTFDMKGPTKRHEMYKEYKANRHGMPDELAEQMPIIKEILRAMNIDIIEKEGYEGDDILGTLAKYGEKQGLEVTILSGDRDTFQLASYNITIRIPRTKAGKTETENYNRAKVLEEYGLEPVQLIEVKALQGDTSDNIPGVKGVGEKAVIPLLNEYGCIENIYDTIENLAPKDEKLLKKFFKDSLGIARSPISYLLKDGIMMTSDAEQLTYKCIEEAVTEEQIKTQEVVREKLGEARLPMEFTCEDGLNKFMNTEIYGLEQSAKESAFMSKQLATIKTDVPQLKDKVLDDLKLDLDKDKLKEKLEKLEIKTLIK